MSCGTEKRLSVDGYEKQMTPSTSSNFNSVVRIPQVCVQIALLPTIVNVIQQRDVVLPVHGSPI